MSTGFTLGKFAPMHKGHEFLISTAIKEMDHVVVVIYCASDVTDIPTSIRANWIKELFPDVEVIIAEDGPQVTGYSDEIIQLQNVYLLDLLDGRVFDAFYSSEKYGEFVSGAFHCQNRVVDIERELVPISSTQIRDTFVSNKEYISKCVYDWIKPRFYFLGGPSTGKTTLSNLCANRLNGTYCKEFGRDYWFQFQQDHRLSMGDLETIAMEQNRLEEEMFRSDEPYTFIDTTTLTTLAYANYYFGEASEYLLKIIKTNLYKYKNVFLCDEDIPFEDTWDRSGPASRGKIQDLNIKLLQGFGIPYSLLSGTIEQRFNSVKNYMEGLK